VKSAVFMGGGWGIVFTERRELVLENQKRGGDGPDQSKMNDKRDLISLRDSDLEPVAKVGGGGQREDLKKMH